MAGFFRGWVQRSRMSEWLTLPLEHLDKHGLVVGQPGTGKTETLLRLAALVREHYGWQVIYLDLKGEEKTQRRFVANMRAIPNTAIRTFPASYYDGWRGDKNAIYNRLMAIQEFTEPYYKSASQIMLKLAIGAPAGVPRSSAELLARLNLDTLRELYDGHPESIQLENIALKDARGVSMRYWAFFASMEGQLDGNVAYEDADALYILVPGFALRDEGKMLGRFLIEDFVSYAALRKRAGVKTLFIVDEINTLDMDAESFSSYEKARGFDASVIASSQTYGALGKYRDRIAGSSHLTLVHRCPDPDELIERAGEEERIAESWSVESGDTSFGRGQIQLRPQSTIDPTEVKRLGQGELFVICQGYAQKARVASMPVTDQQLADAQRSIDQEQARREQQERQVQTVQATHQAQPEPDDLQGPEEM